MSMQITVKLLLLLLGLDFKGYCYKAQMDIRKFWANKWKKQMWEIHFSVPLKKKTNFYKCVATL